MKTLVKLLFPGVALLFLAAFFTPVQAQDKEKEKDIFLVVEEMPQFQGGDITKFTKWVMTQVKYPEEALKNKISGKVFANFVIDEQGKVGDIKIKRGVDPLLDDEVIRVLKTSPDWTPGKQKGKKVKVGMAIPVSFKLS